MGKTKSVLFYDGKFYIYNRECGAYFTALPMQIMKFFKLTREKPTTGLMTIKLGDEVKVVNVSTGTVLLVELSNTDGKKESFTVTDEVYFENNTSYLSRPYSRFEVMIQNPASLGFRDEIHCKVSYL